MGTIKRDHNLNSLKGSIQGSTIGVIKWDARSLDYLEDLLT